MLRNKTIASVAFILAALPVTAGIADEGTWKADVYDFSVSPPKLLSYVPRAEKATKQWNICFLAPHMKDSFWVAADYGLVQEARRQGIKLTILQAGGYDQLPKQLSQFDDCMAAHADAIITAPISESGFGEKFKQGLAAGIPQIAAFNPVSHVPVTAKMAVDVRTNSRLVGEAVVKSANGKPLNAVAFPGPQGSGWAEDSLAGFKDAIKGTSVTLLDAQFGDTGVDVQRKLVEDALQAYPNVDVIFGTSPTAEAAVGAVAEAGRSGQVAIWGGYDNVAEYNLLKKGDVHGFAVLFSVIQGEISIDLAVRALEKDLPDSLKNINVAPAVITSDNYKDFDTLKAFAPDDWKPIYSVN
jgi:protein TorT